MRPPGPYLAAQDFLRAAGPGPTYDSSVGSSQTSRQSSTACVSLYYLKCFMSVLNDVHKNCDDENINKEHC